MIASTDAFGVRVLFGYADEAEIFGAWLRSSGWFVRLEPTTARNPYALRRTREEEDLVTGIVAAYGRWEKAAQRCTIPR